MVTYISPILLQAALRRNGVWLVDAKHSTPTDFYHKVCFNTVQRTLPRSQA
jgi:hypothetical protein